MNLYEFLDKEDLVLWLQRFPKRNWVAKLRIPLLYEDDEVYESSFDEELYVLFGKGDTPTQAIVDLAHTLRGKILLRSNGETLCSAPMVMTL